MRSSTESTFPISDKLYIGYTLDSTRDVYSRIFNGTNQNTCFDHGNTYSGNSTTTQNTSVGTNTCDNIKYTNLYSNYGLSVYFDATGATDSMLTYYLNYTPPVSTGQTPVTYTFSQTLMWWTI